jgi:hypothetical protein
MCCLVPSWDDQEGIASRWVEWVEVHAALLMQCSMRELYGPFGPYIFHLKRWILSRTTVK